MGLSWLWRVFDRLKFFSLRLQLQRATVVSHGNGQRAHGTIAFCFRSKDAIAQLRVRPGGETGQLGTQLEKLAPLGTVASSPREK
jgi:hypothetical protein